MIHIAIAFLLSALWMIFSPYSLTITISLILIIAGIIFCKFIVHLKNHRVHYLSIFTLIGLLLGSFLYDKALLKYQIISENLPLTIEGSFSITQQSKYSTTITLKTINHIENHKSSDKINLLKKTLKDYEVTLYSVNHLFPKSSAIEGTNYTATLQILPRTYRNIPGNHQQVLRDLGRRNIGYGKIIHGPIPNKSASLITELRYKISDYLMHHFTHGAYLSALSVGITDHLTAEDWQNLRRTGTIHLVSISGLHLSLTAFYAFIIFRILFGLALPRFYIAPYKIAAFLAIFIAWGYTLIAGGSLPTIRAAIMFTVAMVTLILDRPIFSFQSLALALLIILLFMPLSIVTAGFWLSFSAVAILIVTAKLVRDPLTALLSTQLIISLLLIPLSIAFFGEFSLVSPLINLFAISWTATMIMPFLLFGILLLFFTSALATPLLSIANQAIFVLKITIDWAAQLPLAYMQTPKIPLIVALTITAVSIITLYFSKQVIAHLMILRYDFTSSMKQIICPFALLMMLPFFLLSSTIDSQKNILHDPIKIYLIPVGEGLSLLFHSKELTFLYDTGNRYRQFDAGEQTIIPLLRNLGIQKIDYIFLSNDSWQHIGGNRTIRRNFPETEVIAHLQLLPFLDRGLWCKRFNYKSQNIAITPIDAFSSSCGFEISLFDHTKLYLISDITKIEWLQFTHELFRKEFLQQNSLIHHHNILLYPHQGRRYYQMAELLQKIPETTFLFSTKAIDPKISHQLAQLNSLIYNSYHGTIEISIPKINAKPYRRFRIKEYSDKKRFWWYSPVH